MAKLDSPFVYVPDDKIEDFLSKYVNYENEVFGESTIYDNKIVFLGSSGEFVAKGKIYCKQPKIVENLSNAETVDTIPEEYNNLYIGNGTDFKKITLQTLINYINTNNT